MADSRRFWLRRIAELEREAKVLPALGDPEETKRITLEIAYLKRRVTHLDKARKASAR